MNLKLGETTLAEVAAELGFVLAVGLLHMKDQFVHLQWIVVDLSQFDLPGADVRGVIEQVLQFIEIHQRAFELVEIHLFDLGTAGDVADQSRQRSATMRARLTGEAAVNVIAGAITQNDGTARVERRENNFPRLAGALNLASR